MKFIKIFISSHINLIMRFLVRAQIPTEAGNKMVKNPKFLQNLEDDMKKLTLRLRIFLRLGAIELLHS